MGVSLGDGVEGPGGSELEAFGDSGEGGREVAFGCREEAKGRAGVTRTIDEWVGEK